MKFFLLVGGLLVVAVSAWMVLVVPAEEQGRQDGLAQPSIELEPVAEDTEITGTGTLGSLLDSAESLECTLVYNNPAQTSPIEGTFFVSQSRIRGDFLIPAPDLSGMNLSSLIVDQQQLYSWTMIDGQEYGVKIDLSQSDSLPTTESLSLSSEVEYRCVPWLAVDESVFQPPSSVLFTDPLESFEAGMEYGTVYEEGELPF